MLHICTPLYRYEFLEDIYKTIPKYADITWHLVKISTRHDPELSFLKDPRVKVYQADCLDSDTVTKRNLIFSKLNEGYFYLLDDDTIFLENVYNTYKKYNNLNFEGLICGQMHSTKEKNPKIVNPKIDIDPNKIYIDTGAAICHVKVLKHVKWDWVKLEDDFGNDFLFWSRCCKFIGFKNCIIENVIFLNYNYFAPKLRIRRKILFFNINFDTNNYFIIKIYNILLKIGFKARKLIGLKRNPINKFPYY